MWSHCQWHRINVLKSQIPHDERILDDDSLEMGLQAEMKLELWKTCNHYIIASITSLYIWAVTKIDSVFLMIDENILTRKIDR